MLPQEESLDVLKEFLLHFGYRKGKDVPITRAAEFCVVTDCRGWLSRLWFRFFAVAPPTPPFGGISGKPENSLR